MDIRRKLYFYFYFIVIQEVNHRVGRNQIDVVDIGGGLKVKINEWRTQVKCCTIVYSYVLWCPEFNEGLTNRKILIFLDIPKPESRINNNNDLLTDPLAGSSLLIYINYNYKIYKKIMQ